MIQDDNIYSRWNEVNFEAKNQIFPEAGLLIIIQNNYNSNDDENPDNKNNNHNFNSNNYNDNNNNTIEWITG